MRLINGVPLYVAKVSGKSLLRIHYQWTFATITLCQSQIYNCFRTANRSNFILNHERDTILDKRIRNTIQSIFKYKIKKETENGLEAFQIRLNIRFCGFYHFYFIKRRKFLEERPKNDVVDSFNTIDELEGWSSVSLRDEDQIYNGLQYWNFVRKVLRSNPYNRWHCCHEY